MEYICPEAGTIAKCKRTKCAHAKPHAWTVRCSGYCSDVDVVDKALKTRAIKCVEVGGKDDISTGE